MSDHPIVVLAALMGLATYATRITPFLLPVERIPPRLLRATRTLGPATLAAVAAVALALPGDPVAEPAVPAVGMWLATGLCVALVAARRDLTVGIIGALVVGVLVTLA